MELKIYSPAEDGFIKKIEWNYEELKKEMQKLQKFLKDSGIRYEEIPM